MKLCTLPSVSLTVQQLWEYISKHGELISKITDHISVFSVRELLIRLLVVDVPGIDTATV